MVASASPCASSSAPNLRQIIETAAKLLPAQGPITSFAFLNPLEALEELPFHTGIVQGATLQHCQPYLSEVQYREHLAAGRIDAHDLRSHLKHDLGTRGDESILGLCTRFELRMALLSHTFPTGKAEELDWVMTETDAIEKCRPELHGARLQEWLDSTRRWVISDSCAGRIPLDVLLDTLSPFDLHHVEQWTPGMWQTAGLQLLWNVCCHAVERAGEALNGHGRWIRHRDALRHLTQVDSDEEVLAILGPYCAAFTDQGLSQWRLPTRDLGFLRGFQAVCGSLPRGSASLIQNALERMSAGLVTPVDLIDESLQALGVAPGEVQEFLTSSLLAFRGWAGMLWQMEVRSDRVPNPVPPGTLVEYLALQLLLERAALSRIIQQGCDPPPTLTELRGGADQMPNIRRPEQWAFKLLQLAQLLNWETSRLARFSDTEWIELIQEIAAFPSDERRRLFHMAFERHYRIRAMDAIDAMATRRAIRVEQPKFQAMFCIDAREESFRRHLEEIEPRAETFGNAGFFNVPIYYRGAGEAQYTALCPIVVRPQHWITEEVALTAEEQHRRRAQIRKALGTFSSRVHRGTRDLTAGAILSAGVGVLASVPLVMRILFPRMSARLRRTANSYLQPPPSTRLRLERTDAKAGPEGSGIGLLLDEMVAMGERALRDTGLTSSFAPLVFIFGHGSFCLNNPHKSVYDCGACTGNAGGPNARALAMILNDHRVRKILAERGILIPTETAFIGGLHNTGDDTLTYFDLDMLPSTRLEQFREARGILEQTCAHNARERCRRFYSVPLDCTPQQAHRAVEERTEDLAQTRPEYGNCTNALCFVGRRSRIRGLFLDRRSFQMSYDPTQDDDDGTILGRILGAVVPVCSGINLQYTLSAIDPSGWGAGTKLPHNITSLLGVMDGAASDLRCGLPWQGVDIHEPMRLLFVMETRAERLLKIMDRNPVVRRILANGWAQLALLDPDSAQVSMYAGGRFLPYQSHGTPLSTAKSSYDWFRGRRDHLEFAVIENGLMSNQPVFSHEKEQG